MSDIALLVLQAIGVAFLLLFARGVYIIWTATEPAGKEELQAALAKEERGQEITVSNQYERETYTEAKGRLHLIKRKLAEWWPL